MGTPTDAGTGCCSIFDPSLWDKKEFRWKDKLFLTDSVFQIFHIPLNIGQVISRMYKKVKRVDACPPDKEFLILAYDPSPWKSILYMSATKEVPGAVMERLSGSFMSRVYEGPYGSEPKWLKDMESYVAKHGKSIKKPYFFYATCPECAKKYGKNYVVLIAHI